MQNWKMECEVCEPISSLETAWTYMKNLPKWVDRIVDLAPRSRFVVKNAPFDCHAEQQKFAPSLRLDRDSVPRTLVCHDMKGGYVEDRFIEPINCGNGYTFYRWAQIDIFVYFSHHLITIPPLSWINIAHLNGVKILGTFITEWTPGEEVCREIFRDADRVEAFVKVLIDICILFKLDGWLLNIENGLENTTLLKEFVRRLTEGMHCKRPGSLIIWYDSIVESGKLKWQNELNALNRCYFDLCDGIFLNYSWKEDNLKNTAEFAGHRCLDVYVGVDVFGRNFYGGGNFNTYLAVEKIREHNLSMAIFAQGWTHETLKLEPLDTLHRRFLARDNRFWKSLWSYLYTHPIKTFFQTFFYVGVDKEWFKLNAQELQLSQFLHSKSEYFEEFCPVETCNCLQLHFEDAYSCCLITNKYLFPDSLHVHRLFFCDIEVTGAIIVHYYAKKNSDCLNLILLTRTESGVLKKVVCRSTVSEDLVDNCSILEVNQTYAREIVDLVANEHTVLTDWILKCYLLDLVGSTILELGAQIDEGDTACLHGIGIMESDICIKKNQNVN